MKVFKIEFFYMVDWEWVEFEAIGTTLNKLKAEIDNQWCMSCIKDGTLKIEETTGDISMPYFFNEKRKGYNP